MNRDVSSVKAAREWWASDTHICSCLSLSLRNPQRCIALKLGSVEKDPYQFGAVFAKELKEGLSLKRSYGEGSGARAGHRGGWANRVRIGAMIARGIMLGVHQPVILHMLDIPPAVESLNGVKMELIDAAFPLLKGVVATTDVAEACKDVNIAVMVGGFPRKEGMERKDVMSKNVSIYKAQASALEQYAAKDLKVLVVANPANTNALILKEFAPSIPEKNISCLTRLDHNRALGQVAERLGVPVSSVKNVIIWGNHSSSQYPDVNHAVIAGPDGDKPVRSAISDDAWLDGDFIKVVQQRGAAIIKARKLSSALSAASSACDHIRDWVLGTPKGTWVSMGVYSDGSYDVPPGIIYSYPVTCEGGAWSIVQGLPINEFSRAKLDATAAELVEEKGVAYSCISG